MKDNLLSVVMPALNEEDHIVLAINDVLKAFDDFSINGEIIVINDGSTDKTKDRVEAVLKKDVRVNLSNHDIPQGVGSSFWAGVDISKGNAVCMIPGDNENDPWETLRYYRLLEHVDIIVPFVFNKEVRPFYRYLLSSVYLFIINTTLLVNFNYTNGTIIYRKSILKKLTSRKTGFFYQTDILIRSIKNGYLFAEVPYRLGLRASGTSKALSFSSLIKVAHGYLVLVKDLYTIRKLKSLYEIRMGREKRIFLEDTQTAKRYKH